MSSTQPLLAHAPVTPLSTTTSSAVPVGALAVIEWCIFDGHTHKDVVGMYNGAGYGSVSTKYGISYQVRRWGPVWYQEQGAVRPWELYTKIEKEEFKKEGLSGEDFKFVHPRELDVVNGVVHVRGQPRGLKEKRREAARRRSQGKAAKQPVNTAQSRNASRISSAPRASSSSSRPLRTPNQVQPGHSPNSTPPPAIPEHLRIAIKAKHDEWLRANERGETEMADLVEQKLESLERQAMKVSLPGFLAWKFGPEHIGAAVNR